MIYPIHLGRDTRGAGRWVVTGRYIGKCGKELSVLAVEGRRGRRLGGLALKSRVVNQWPEGKDERNRF